jgi:hypothetical protein
MKANSWRIIACLAGFLLVRAEASPRQQASQPFVLAAADFMSGLRIVGRYDGAKWVNTWPQPAESDVPVPPLAKVPEAWLGQPVPRNWTLWLFEGTKMPVTIDATRRGLGVGGACFQALELVMKLPPDVPPMLLRDGIAVNADQPIEDFEEFNPADQQWIAFEPFVRGAARPLANQAIARWRVDADLRSRVGAEPLRLTALHRPRRYDVEPLVYFFTATQQVAVQGGSWGVRVSGWVTGDVVRPQGSFGLTASAFEDYLGSSQKPAAVIRVPGHVFWLMRTYGPESQGFSIYEITDRSARELLATWAGGC